MQSISLAYVDIVNFCTKAKAVFRRGRHTTTLSISFKLTWKPFEQQFGQQIEEFRFHVKSIEKEASISHMIEAADARAVVLANKLALEEAKKESDHRQFISGIPSVNYIAKHEKIRQARYEGTGTWIFDDEIFRDWMESQQSSILCCHGIPGCGKTVLASAIIDRLESRNDVRNSKIVYYYCDYSDQRTLQIDSIIGTLLKQCFVGGLVPEYIDVRIPLDHIRRGHSVELNTLMDMLSLAFRLSPATVVIIDGLDELEKQCQKEIIASLCSLTAYEAANVKTLILCREEDQLILFLQDIPKLRLTPSALKDDIKSFVTGSVKSRIGSGELRIRNPSLESEIVSELVNKAHGMFLWVFFQLNDLCEAPSDATIRETLQNLPNGLAETYERIIIKIKEARFKA